MPADSSETRKRILSAALLHFAEHGFDGASMRAIASRSYWSLALVDTFAKPMRAGRCLLAKARREFSHGFEREAVALLESGGRPLTGVAGEVRVSPSMSRNWRVVVRGNGGQSQGGRCTRPLPSPADHASEITRLQRELDHARLERDVLKEAIGIFAEVPG